MGYKRFELVHKIAHEAEGFKTKTQAKSLPQV
jgi:hypothetical protein